ncbi:MAG: outer membrane protein assembly factor BamB family protein [Thermoguttaceae bacterium]
MRRTGSLATTGILAVAAAASLIVPLSASDWPGWRGATQNGVTGDTGLPDSTDDVLWRVPMGSRCSTPAIVGGRVFCINLAGEGVHEQERVFALDLATGRTVWEDRFSVFHTDVPDSRVGWSNVVVDPETRNVYAHGVQGFLRCYTRDGKLLWSNSLTETVGRISGYGGRTNTPIIDEDRVVISFVNSSFGSQAKGGHRFLALNKHTGEMLWWSEPGEAPEDTTYSTPVVATVAGRRLLIGGVADGSVCAMDARTGEPLWRFLLSKRGMNASVVVENERVYATHSEENYDSTEMGRVVCIDARGTGEITKTHEIWRRDGIAAGYASPLLQGGRLYVMTNSGVLHCLDTATGQDCWRHTVGRVGKGSPVWGDGKIYVNVVDSKFAIIRDDGDKAETLGTMSFRSDRGAVELFGSPAIADGRVVFFTSEEAICLGEKGSDSESPLSPQNTLVSTSKAETAPATKLARIQVRPCEVLLSPGEKVPFETVGFDEAGGPLGRQEIQWSVAGPVGTIDAQGRFVAQGQKGGIGTVSAKRGDLSATARVRVVPALPIAEDFESFAEDGMIDWWIGVGKAKFALATIDGSRVLKKLADDRGPIFNRVQGYITEPIPAGYSVEADLRGDQEGRRRGDVGLVNSGYRMELFGRTQKARVVSWVPAPRFEKEIEFPWQAERWYTARLQVLPEGDAARVLAKIWPKGDAEPEAWTIEATDPQPVLEGSAGIYAYSMAPVYFDNIQVSPSARGDRPDHTTLGTNP